MIILAILGLIIGGVIIGALGRLAIPGPNPMSLPMTALVGVGGSLLGGLVGSAGRWMDSRRDRRGACAAGGWRDRTLSARALR